MLRNTSKIEAGDSNGKQPKRERPLSTETASRKKIRPAEGQEILTQKPFQASFKHVRT